MSSPRVPSVRRGPLLLGADVGGTKLAAGIVTLSGEILAWRRAPTPEGPEAALDALAALCRSVLRDIADGSGLGGAADVVALGIACGGPLDRESGVVLDPLHLPGWRDVSIVERLGTALALPAAVDNDATACALGEAWWGAGAGLPSLLFYTISTGIGGGLVLDGRPYRGGGNAGEFGHATVRYDGEPCSCGSRGCIETVASGTAIARRARAAIRGGAGSVMADLAGSLEAVTAETVVAAVRSGDATARGIWEETITALGAAIASQVVALDPAIVALGGGVTGAGDLLLEPVRAAVAERSARMVRRTVPVVASRYGPRLGALGAAAIGAEAVGLLPASVGATATAGATAGGPA